MSVLTSTSRLRNTASPSEIVALARSLAPMLRERAAETEAARTLPPETVRDFKEAGLFRLMQPARFGGLEMGFDVLMNVAVEIGKGCGSCAWVFVVLNSGWLVAGYPEQAQQEVWGGNPGAVIGNVLAPSTDVTPVQGGYRIGGRWSFSSGIDHADWQIVSGLTYPEVGPPEVTLFLLPKINYEIEDSWYAVGLCGTGSKTVVAKDVFVPKHRAVLLAKFRTGTQPGAAVNLNPLYRMPMGVTFPLSLSSPILGVALGTYDLWREWTSTRLTRGIHKVAEQVPVQIRLAEAAAEIDSAELLLRRDMAEAMRILAADEMFTSWHRARSRRDGAYALELCVRAMDRLFAASGGTGLYHDHPVQRAWRDVHAGAAHIGLRWDDAATTFGRIEFGLGFDNPFFD